MAEGSVIVILGCRAGSPALNRRALAGRDAFVAHGADFIVACGGRAWGGRVEADALAAMLVEGGVPQEAVVRERCSLDTRGNARFAAAVLARRGVLRPTRVILVTCAWHMPRAMMLFERAGVVVEALPVEPPQASRLARAYWFSRERFTTWKDARRPMRLP